jgi:hypothetical protein
LDRLDWVNGKTIRIFLADGEPTGILLAEISNWTGKVIVAPRSQLDQLSKREEVRRTGVYLLVGSDPDDSSVVIVSEDGNLAKSRGSAGPAVDAAAGLSSLSSERRFGRVKQTRFLRCRRRRRASYER